MVRSVLDRPDILRVLFHPRRDYAPFVSTPAIRLIDVQVEPGLIVAGRLYPAEADSPAILFFHGNGEIAADYDQIAPLYARIGITLLVMDYRGYGRSGGGPRAENLLQDARYVYRKLAEIWAQNGLSPESTYVMGRSLGSAAAIEVALRAGKELAGLIIESGFADTFALLRRLGAYIEDADDVNDGFGNLAKIGQVDIPTLILHGERDVLIPPEDGRQLYTSSAAADKRLELIPGAGHNDIMMVGMRQYFQAIERYVFGN